MSKFNTAEAASKATKGFNGRVGPLKDNFVIRCVEEKFHMTKDSGNKGVMRKWEIVSPQTIQVNGEIIEMAGSKFDQYRMLEIIGDEKKSNNNINFYKEELTKLGLTVEEELDTDMPILHLKDAGLLVDAVVSTKESTQHKNPTPEQVAKGMKVGDVLKDPATGKPLIRYQLQLGEILGISTSAEATSASGTKPF